VSTRGAFNAIAYRDLLFNMILGLVMFLGIFMLLVNVEKSKEDEATEPPGNLQAMIMWDPGQTDIDLWVYGPGEKRPIGYSNKTGANWSLLRDDLGNINDTMPANVENAFSRAVAPGRYVFNLHAYSGITYPQTVSFELSVLVNGKSRVLLTTSVTLVRKGQEVTVVSLDLDKDGNVVPGSANSVFFPMFKAWQ
jgi:uncharacterized protein YfaP (DUF2135 family)